MSRARLGLYVFGRANLFSNCYELQPTFSQLLARPQQLALVPGEHYGHCSRQVDAAPEAQAVSGLEQMAAIVQHMCTQWEGAAAAWARSQGGTGTAAAAAGAVAQAVQATAPPEAADAGEEGEESARDGRAEGEGSEDVGGATAMQQG